MDSSDTVKCKACGLDMPENAVFCGSCGTPVEKEPAAVEAANPIWKCKNCGTEIKDEIKFCGVCGTPAGSSGPSSGATVKQISSPKKNVKKIIVPVAIALIAVAALIIAAVLFIPPKYGFQKGNVYISQGSDGVVVIPHNKNRQVIEGYIRKINGFESMSSLDGTKAAFMIDEKRIVTYAGAKIINEGYDLYLVTETIQRIDSGVYYFYLAASGNAIAYVKEYDPLNENCELWLYSNGNKTRITSRLGTNFEDNFVAISPDGRTLAYTTVREERYAGVLWNGSENDLGSNVFPFAVSNDTKYLYYKRNESFYVQKGLNNENREKLGENSRNFHLNRDLSQIVYIDGVRTYISTKGESRLSLSGTMLNFILPGGTGFIRSENMVSFIDVANFSNTFYVNGDDSLIRINGKYETDSVARNVKDVFLAKDGKTLNYIRTSNNRLHRLNGLNAKAEPVQVSDVFIRNLYAIDDGKSVFYVNDDYDIFYLKGEGKPFTVSNNFSSRGSLYSRIVLFNGNTLFYIADDELYMSTGGRGSVIRAMNGDVKQISTNMITLEVTTEDYGDVLTYRSSDGNKFDLINENPYIKTLFDDADIMDQSFGDYRHEIIGIWGDETGYHDYRRDGYVIFVDLRSKSVIEGLYIIYGDNIIVKTDGGILSAPYNIVNHILSVSYGDVKFELPRLDTRPN